MRPLLCTPMALLSGWRRLYTGNGIEDYAARPTVPRRKKGTVPLECANPRWLWTMSASRERIENDAMPERASLLTLRPGIGPWPNAFPPRLATS